jgi:hypothetical protein
MVSVAAVLKIVAASMEKFCSFCDKSHSTNSNSYGFVMPISKLTG